MLVEREMNKALNDFAKGRKVVVIQQWDDGEMGITDLEKILPQDARYLVEVPAVENPDFAEAVEKMVKKKPVVVAGEKKPKPEVSESAEEEASGGDSPKKTLRQQVMELSEQGLSIREMADRTGAAYQTVWKYAKDLMKEQKEQKPAAGHNKDGHLCPTCQYRGRKGINGCDYLQVEGHSRGCRVEDCDRYIKGDKLPVKED